MKGLSVLLVALLGGDISRLGVEAGVTNAIITSSNSTNPSPTSVPTASGAYINPHVPTGKPIVGDYGGQYRPQVHFSPPQYFMNDPNGIFRDDNGTWHLYYQYNPTDYVARNQHWGHATSRDLYHWENQPIALFPPEKTVYVFSGSAVVDVNNTSGFFAGQRNGVVAIYRRAAAAGDCVLFGWYSFIPYEHNPVIPSNSTQFRDPKVFWYNDHWVMAVSYATEFTIGIFTSPNLKSWSHASNFSHHGLLGLQYECPNLVRMPYVDEKGDRHNDMWLLAISINPGAPLGGSTPQYFPGSFNGTHFEVADGAARIADFGKDNYAGQFFYGLSEDEDPVFVGWASNWQYTQVVPTAGEKWRSAMSLPRRVHLVQAERVGWKLASVPYDMAPILGDVVLSNSSHGNGTLSVDFSHISSNALYWEVNVTGLPEKGISAAATLNFTLLSPQSGEYLRGGYYFGGDTPFFIDRGGVRGFDNVFFTDKVSTNNLQHGDSWSMSGVLDWSLLEDFVDGGVESATTTFYSVLPLSLFVFSTADLPVGVKVSVRVNALKSAWAAMESSDGLVHGNQSLGNMGAEKMERLLI